MDKVNTERIEDAEGQPMAPLKSGEANGTSSQAHDAVFGDLNEEGPNYRAVGWLGTVAIMMKTQIGLGVLAIPSVYDKLGIVPGTICLVAIGGITTWSDWMIGVFKLLHPEVYCLDDAGQLMFGRVGREFLGIAYCLNWIFGAGSAMVSISIGFNAVSSHGTCTAVFVVVAAIIAFLCASIRTLGRIKWLAWVGLTGILVAVFSLTIAVAVEDRPAAAPKDAHWQSDYKLVGNPSFTEAITAVTSLVFAYSATPAFFAIVSEMRDPTQFTKATIVAQSLVTIIYLIIGTIVYYYCGSYVATPALGSAGNIMKKVSYGFALPGLLATCMLIIHYPAKYIFVRLLRNTKHLTSETWIHWSVWLGCTFVTSLIAYLIASGVPNFGALVGLIGALFSILMCFQPMGCMWFYDNWSQGRQNPSLKWYGGVVWAGFVVVSGTFLTIAGTYGAIIGIIESYQGPNHTSPWSCADNPNSV